MGMGASSYNKNTRPNGQFRPRMPTQRLGEKKVRKLGKWVDGYDGRITKTYAEKRRKRMKMASDARARNR